jgi:hypothetical protein
MMQGSPEQIQLQEIEVEEELSVESKVCYCGPVANESSGGKITYCYHFPGKTG